MGFIKELTETAFVGNQYYVAYIVSLLLCLMLMNKRRIKFVFPMLIMSVAVLNPWFYDWWVELAGYAYWRIVWIIPILPICAALPVIIAEKIKDDRIKLKIGIIMIAILAGMGKLIYKTPAGRFEVVADNNEKLPQYVIDASDALLKIDEHPRVVASTDISVYMRQYTGEIDTLFGRDIYGHILFASDKARKVNNEINSPDGDMTYVAGIMLDDGYDYLVLRGETDDRRRELSDAGFEIIYGTEDYSIYKVTGTPSVVKDRNELGQVICETIVDKDGNPTEGSGGYAYTYYEYDNDGNVSRLFRTNLNGEGVLDNNYSAGYERTYDRYGQVLFEKNLGVDGKPALNNKGYVEVIWEYNKKLWISESFCDENGKLKKTMYGYSRCSRVYDSKGNVIKEAYYDESDNLVSCLNGYASIERKYDEFNRVIEETYHDNVNKPCLQVKGYSKIKYTYDEAGNIIQEAYYDENDNSVACIKGYAKVEREYDQDRHLIKEKYYNPDGISYVTDEGYSGVLMSYDEDDNLISKKYIDENGDMVITKDGYAETRWEKDEVKDVWDIKFYDDIGTEISIEDVNLYTEMYDGWSEWMSPYRDVQNSCFSVGNVNLGEKKEGDEYVCEIEIEFKNVTATEGKDFRFWTQGAADGKWTIGNVWNTSLIYLEEAPDDGVYTYTVIQPVNEAMQYASTFNIGFRCDNWASGSFRVRNINIKKCLK